MGPAWVCGVFTLGHPSGGAGGDQGLLCPRPSEPLPHGRVALSAVEGVLAHMAQSRPARWEGLTLRGSVWKPPACPVNH